MAEIKKYLDTTALGALVDNIKAEDAKVLQSAKDYAVAEDAKVLQSAKDYADGLAVNYDAAGSASTALQNAQAYADQAEADAVASAKSYTDTEVAKANAAAADAKTQADKGVADAATAQAAAVAAQGTADQAVAAAATADGKAVAAQEDVDELTDKVGEVPEGQTVMGIITNIQENAYDDTAIKADIKKNTDAIAAMDTAYKAADAGLQGAIDGVSAKVTTLVGEDADKSVRAIANEELAKQLIAEDAQESLDTLGEIAAWIQSHPGDAAAMNKAIEDLEAFVGALPEGVTATTVVGYIQEVVAAEQARAEGAESDLSDRLDDVEAALGTGEGSVADQIADAKQEAIETAAADATTKAGNAETAAKTYADGLNTAMNTRVEALEAVDHEHKNFDLLETYTQTEANLADAVAKKHEHSNKDVLDGITAQLVQAWGAAEKNAKDYADGLNTAMTGKVDAIDTRVDTLEAASATHALKTDLEAAVARIATNEGNIAANTSAINSFTAITEAEVDALFA